MAAKVQVGDIEYGRLKLVWLLIALYSGSLRYFCYVGKRVYFLRFGHFPKIANF